MYMSSLERTAMARLVGMTSREVYFTESLNIFSTSSWSSLAFSFEKAGKRDVAMG